MTRICRGGTLTPQGQDSWVIPALPNDEGGRQCTESGGVIEESGPTGCGTESNAQSNGARGGQAAQALATASIAPVRRLRDAMAHTALVTNLELLNRSEEVQAILTDDAELSDRFADLIAQTSEAAASLLTWPGGPEPARLTYSAELHASVCEFADDLAGRMSDNELRQTLERSVAEAEGLVGTPLVEILARYGREQADSAD